MEDMDIVEYLEENGNSPFGKWFNRLNSAAAARITTALYRLGKGNFSNTKSVGKGVLEYKLNFGPGYRIYFGRDGNQLVILLNGGMKKQQDADIKRARQYWSDYKRRKIRE